MADVLCVRDGSLEADVKCKKSLGFKERSISFSQEYQVRSRNLDESWSTIQYDPQLPQLGDLVNGCRCKGYNFKEVQTVFEGGRARTLYTVKYDFDSETVGSSGFPKGSGNRSPNEWPFEFDFDSTSYTGPLLYDPVTGEMVANPVGEIMPLETDFGALTLNVTGYDVLTFDPSTYIQRLYRVNSSVFLNMGAGHCLIKSLTARRVPIAGRYWFRVNYQIEMRDNSDAPYKAEILNHGTKCRTEIDGEIKTTMEVLGKNCTVNLDANGVMYEGSEPLTLSFNKYRPIDFSTFLPVERFQAAIDGN